MRSFYLGIVLTFVLFSIPRDSSFAQSTNRLGAQDKLGAQNEFGAQAEFGAQDAKTYGPYWGPPVQVFDRETHPGDEAFWAVTQDSTGAIIAGNSWGPLKFNGLRWELVPMPPPAYQPVLSLVTSQDGKVYFTSVQDFGYLTESSSGQTQYVSLKKMASSSLGVAYIPKSVQVQEGGAAFVAPEGIIFVQNDSLSHWKSTFRIREAFNLGGGMLVLGEENAACVLVRTTCREQVALRPFASEIALVKPLNDSKILIGLRSGLLFEWTLDGSLKRIQTDADWYLNEHELYSGIILKDGSMVFWTFRKGGVWLDKNGKLLSWLDHEHTDIPNTIINDAVEDRDGDLWLATGSALVHVALRSQVNILPRFGPDDLNIVGAAIVGNEILFGGNEGVWVAPKNPFGVPNVKRLDADVSRIFRMGGVHGTAFVFSEDHLLALDNGQFVDTGAMGGRDIIHGFKDSTQVTVGSGSGITVVAQDEGMGGWNAVQSHEFGHNVMDLAWDSDGTLWTTVEPGGVLRVEFDHSTDSVQSVQHFAQVEDYPMDISQVEFVWGSILFISDAGIVTPDLNHPDNFVLEDISGLPWTPPRAQAGLMISDGKEMLVARFPNGIGVAESKKWRSRFLPYSNDQAPLVIDSTLDSRILWSWGQGRVSRYNLNREDDYPESWKVNIRSVWSPDTVAFNRNALKTRETLQRGVESIRFEVSAPRYRNVEQTKFRYRLIGLNSSWSELRSDPNISFSVLKPNKYTLEVQGVDGQGLLSEITRWSFRVRAPWYLTTEAFFAWILILVLATGLGIFALFRRRVRLLEQTHMKLESLVEDRTEEIQRQTVLLKELDESRSRFFANVSHEFRTPLTLITAPILEALEGEYGDLPVSAQTAFKRAQLNSDRLLRLVNQLLDLARLESGQLRAELERVDVAAFCRRIVSMFEYAAVARGVDLSIEIPDESIWICLDFQQMEKVVVNLLSNALKFTPEGGSVRVRVVKTASGCRIEVTDSGIGIPKEAINRVFDRFFQVDDASTRSREGLGIGLAMSKELVELHEGTIDVHSTLGKGSSFVLSLPTGNCIETASGILNIEPYPIPVDSGNQEHAAHESPTATSLAEEEAPIVLIVEDNVDMRAYIAELFASTYKVVEAHNGKSGMQAALQFIPDIIVSDLMMPDVDGIEFCRSMRADPRTSHIPFIMLTAKVDQETRLESLDTGADLYLEKPFDPQELRVHLDNLVRTRRALQDYLRGKSTSKHAIESPIHSLSTPDKEFVERVEALSEDLVFNSTFGVDQFADELHMSRRQLLRKMKALFGETPREYIQRLRFEKACRMLESGEPVDLTATTVGYSDRPSFTRAFIEIFGISPSKWGR